MQVAKSRIWIPTPPGPPLKPWAVESRHSHFRSVLQWPHTGWVSQLCRQIAPEWRISPFLPARTAAANWYTLPEFHELLEMPGLFVDPTRDIEQPVSNGRHCDTAHQGSQHNVTQIAPTCFFHYFPPLLQDLSARAADGPDFSVAL